MTTRIDPTTTLADLVTAHPGLARELERRGLDYCCGGGESIDAACRAAGLDPEEVAGELASVAVGGDEAPWATMSPRQLVDHLEATHHRYLWDELPRLEALAEKIAAVHGDRHPELHEVQRLVAEVRLDLESHLPKEEQVLFPRIREMAAPGAHPGGLGAPIACMMTEHDHTGGLLARLRTVTNDYRVPSDGCASYQACYDGLAALEADTHLHIHKENNLLFPAVQALEEEQRQREEALLAGGKPAR